MLACGLIIRLLDKHLDNINNREMPRFYLLIIKPPNFVAFKNRQRICHELSPYLIIQQIIRLLFPAGAGGKNCR
jgi:hypothetical protein